MIIKKLTIKNFKKFDSLEIELNALDCLVGINNSGKTTLLQSLALFDFCIHNCIARKLHNGKSNGSFEIKNRSIAPDEFIVLPVADPLDLWTGRQSQKAQKHILISVCVVFENGRQAEAKVDLNFNRYSIALDTEPDENWLKDLIQLKVSYLPVFSSFLTQEERRTPAVIEDALARGRINSVIRNLLYNLKEKGKIVELEEILQRAIPSFKNLSIAFDEVSDRFINVSYREQGRKKDFDIFMAGSGFQQFVYLFGFILLRDPSVVLLDEPDVHLHGSLQANLFEEIRLLANRGKQIIFATHSRDLISRLEPGNILVLDENKTNRLTIEYDIYETLSALGTFDNLELIQIQTYKRVLVLENEYDWKLIQEFGKKILGEDVGSKVFKRLSIWYAKGNPGKQDISKLREQLGHMLGIRGAPIKIFVISDRDYYPYREEKLKDLSDKDSHVQWHIFEKNEIENYLLVYEAIERLVNTKYGKDNLFGTQSLERFNHFIEEGGDKAQDALVKAFDEYSRNKRLAWDPSTCSQKAREYITENWNKDPTTLVDAKTVLSKTRQWLQDNGVGSFSNEQIAKHILIEELPEEILHLLEDLEKFTIP